MYSISKPPSGGWARRRKTHGWWKCFSAGVRFLRGKSRSARTFSRGRSPNSGSTFPGSAGSSTFRSEGRAAHFPGRCGKRFSGYPMGKPVRTGSSPHRWDVPGRPGPSAVRATSIRCPRDPLPPGGGSRRIPDRLCRRNGRQSVPLGPGSAFVGAVKGFSGRRSAPWVRWSFVMRKGIWILFLF